MTALFGATRSAAANDAWQITETTVPLTGAVSLSAALASAQPLQNMVGVPAPATLVLRCQDGGLAAYVAWPQVLAINGTAFMSTQTQTMVLWRLDNAPIAVNFWDRSDSGTAAGKFTSAGAIKLFTQLAHAKQLVVRMTGEITQDAVFDLGEVATVAAKVEGACGAAQAPSGAKP